MAGFDSDQSTFRISKLLEESARVAMKFQREDGSFPPGRNGAYREPETPVRTTSHWLTTLSKVYEITGERKFADAAHDAAEYLLTETARPHGYTFYSRNEKGKDKCDGVIGQAAPIRGLSYAGQVLDRTDLLETAREVFLLHPFDSQIGLWERVEIDGSKLSYDRTMNHQLVFAAAGSNLAGKYHKILARVRAFLDKLKSNIFVSETGVVRQYAKPPLIASFRSLSGGIRHWRLLLNWFVATYSSRTERLADKEIGYLPVNAKALGKLYYEFPEHPVWSSEFVKDISTRIGEVTDSYELNEYRREYGSMIPGIHFAAAQATLCQTETHQCENLLKTEIKNRYDFNENLMVKDTDDEMYMASAIWSLIDLHEYLNDLQISI